MARPHRIEIAGALYHILVRGNQRQDIFLEDQDRREYLKRLERYKKEQDFFLYAYVLMKNHIHLLIGTPAANLSKIMQGINLTYTQYFNKKYGTVGHLFQGRYKSFLCDREGYLLSLVRYIHLNPVRAKQVKDPEEYPWSSHIQYLTEASGLADPERVLCYFSSRAKSARKQYKDFISEKMGAGRDESLYSVVHQQILGDDRFVEEVGRKMGKLEKPLRKPSFQEILKAVEKATGVSAQEILSRARKKEVLTARELLVGACKEYGYRLVDLQPRLRRDLSVLSRLAKVSERPDAEKGRRRMAEILNACTKA
jgi:putative transposase